MKKQIVVAALAVTSLFGSTAAVLPQASVFNSGLSVSAASATFDSIQTLEALSEYTVPITSSMPTNFYVDFTLESDTTGSVTLQVEDNSSASIKTEILTDAGASTGYSTTVTGTQSSLSFDLDAGHYYIKAIPHKVCLILLYRFGFSVKCSPGEGGRLKS